MKKGDKVTVVIEAEILTIDRGRVEIMMGTPGQYRTSTWVDINDVTVI